MSFLTSAASIALPVADIGRSVRFYERLGMRRSSQKGRDGEVFFLLDNLVLTLVQRARSGGFAEPAWVAAPVTSGVGPVQDYSSPQKLDLAVAAAQIAGGQVAEGIRSSFDRFKTAYVEDPDGNQWELKFDSAVTLLRDRMLLPE